MRHPLAFAIVLAGLAVVVTALFLPSPDDPVSAPRTGSEAAGPPHPASEAPKASDEVEAEPPWPSRAWDDFRYGLHLRYPLDWVERRSDALPPGVPGQPVLAVGPPGEDASLAIVYVGPLVPRAGIEAMARRSAQLAGTSVRESGWRPFARREAYRVRAVADGREEETIFFSHRHILFAVRNVAGPEAGGGAVDRLSEVSARLRLD